MSSSQKPNTEALMKILALGHVEIAAGKFQSVEEVFDEIEREGFKTATQAPSETLLLQP